MPVDGLPIRRGGKDGWTVGISNCWFAQLAQQSRAMMLPHNRKLRIVLQSLGSRHTPISACVEKQIKVDPISKQVYKLVPVQKNNYQKCINV